jgi:tRNA(His) 5'-end guanylyltransferase
MFDKLGTELKAIEKSFEATLPLQTPVIMRLDGKAFHTFTRPFKTEPFSDIIHNSMKEAAAVLCKEIQNARFAYTQSDEISILIFEPSDRSQTWFGNRIQKMCSVAASVCSNTFNRQITREILDCPGEGYPVTPFKDSLPRNEACFDVRVFSLPKDKVAAYFQWRQEDAVRNSISMLAQAHFSHRKLHKKNRQEMRAMLQSKGIKWEDLEDWKKNGSTIVKQWREKEGPNGEIVHRSFWDSIDKSPNFRSCTIFAPVAGGPPEGVPECGFIKKHLEQEVTCVNA